MRMLFDGEVVVVAVAEVVGLGLVAEIVYLN
jgi:hypothetical protein